MDDNNHDYSEGLTSQTEVNQTKTEASNEAEEAKKKSAWKWLLAVVLLLAVGFIIALTPSFAERLPDITKEDTSKNVSYSSSSNSTSRSSSSNIETAIVSYAILDFALPVMVAILTFLTLLNTLLFLSMNLNLKDIRRDMQEMYEDFTKNG